MDTAVEPAEQPTQERRPAAAAVLLVAAAAGALLGVLDLAAQVNLPYPWADLANSSAVWAVAAFALGCWVRRATGWVAIAGVVTLTLAVESYYLAAIVALHDSAATLTYPRTRAWVLFGVLAGAVFAPAGAWSRGRDATRAAMGTALGASVLYAEAIVRLDGHRNGEQTAVLEAASGILVLLVAGRSNRQRVVALLICLPLTALGYLAFRGAGFGA